MKEITQTNRLVLREFELADAENFFLLNSDPEVIRFTGDEAFESVETAEEFLKNYDHYQKHGFGRWAVILKETTEFLGWCGLKYTPELDEYDIGFRFFKRHWGKGYATESAEACVKLAFESFDIAKLIGRAVEENIASTHVLEKIGFEFLKKMDCHGMKALIYQRLK